MDSESHLYAQEETDLEFAMVANLEAAVSWRKMSVCAGTLCRCV